MATQIGKAYVQVVPTTRGIKQALNGQMAPEVQSSGRSMGSLMGTAVKTTIGAAAIGKFFASSIMAGGALQQSIGGIETLFKGSADKVKQYASQAYKTAGVSANGYMEQVTSFSASLISSLGGDTAKAADTANMAIIDMADNSNKMGTSIEDIQHAYQGFAKQNYTMLDNLKLGYGGTRSEMQRLLTDAEKITGIHYDINNLNDVYNAIHAIQKQMGITGTTAKEASETLQGSFSAMKAAFTDVMGIIATNQGDLNQSLKALAETGATFLFGNLVPMIGNVLSNLPSAVAVFATSAGQQIMQHIGSGIKADSSLGQALSQIGQHLQPLATSFQTAFGQLPALFSAVSSAMAPVFDTIVNGLASLDFSGISSLVSAILPALTAGFQTFGQIVQPAVEKVVQSFAGLWNAAQPLVSALASALMPAFQVLASFLGGVVNGILSGIAGTFDLLKIVVMAFTPIVQGLVAVFQWLAPVLSVIAQWIGTAIGLFANFSIAGTSLRDIIANAWSNIQTSISVAKQGITLAITNIRAVFSSLSGAGTTLKSALSTAWNAIRGAVSNAAGGIKTAVSSVQNFFNSLKSAGQALLGALRNAWSGIVNAVSSAKNSISGIINGIRNIFNSLGNINLFSAGSAIINGFLNGIKSAFEGVKNFVGGIAQWIKDHKGPISYDRKLLIPAGNAIMSGLNEGLSTRFRDVQSTVSGMAGEIADAFTAQDMTITPTVDLAEWSQVSPAKMTPEMLHSTMTVATTSADTDDKWRGLDQRLEVISTLLQALFDKDSDVYLDKDKVSAIIGREIQYDREMKEKYNNRRLGVIS